MNEKDKTYDKLCNVLTNYENDIATEYDLYKMLCDIQNDWEDVITVQD